MHIGFVLFQKHMERIRHSLGGLPDGFRRRCSPVGVFVPRFDDIVAVSNSVTNRFLLGIMKDG
jgi:hypothetical protein